MGRAPLIVGEPARTFWAACSEDRLTLPRCGGCGRLRWYLQPTCPRCFATAYEWAELSGRGRVFTFTIVHRAFDPGFAQELPYVSAFVTPAEDEAVRLVTRIVGVEPSEVRVGMPVTVTFHTDDLGTRLPLFRPEAET
jgi:uncharacterized OB-fold protein